jgi:hypothetical protein
MVSLFLVVPRSWIRFDEIRGHFVENPRVGRKGHTPDEFDNLGSNCWFGGVFLKPALGTIFT